MIYAVVTPCDAVEHAVEIPAFDLYIATYILNRIAGAHRDSFAAHRATFNPRVPNSRITAAVAFFSCFANPWRTALAACFSQLS